MIRGYYYYNAITSDIKQMAPAPSSIQMKFAIFFHGENIAMR